MNEHFLDELIQSVRTVSDRGRTIELHHTGLQKSGGYTIAYEFEDTESKAAYFLKFSEAGDNGAGEVRALTKAAQLFKNEVLTEPDPTKRLGFVPVPTIVTDDPERFNKEFADLFNHEQYALQLQTAAIGVQAEKELPESMADRVLMLQALAKLLRTCAKNGIAYVDLKPLEHLFWEKVNGEIRITLIDWGIARCNADIALIADDLRKFCAAIPEIIYGKKMLELQNKGKLSYPIQKENRKVLIPLLGTWSFSGDLPPMSQEYALVLGDLLSGSPNDFRIQNRCVEVWDSIINSLEQTALQLQGERAGESDDIDVINLYAENTIYQDKNFSPRDFNAALRGRRLAVSYHPSWICCALRFTQLWYGRIDLIPHTEFEEVIRLTMNGDIPNALTLYDKLSEMISRKIAQSESHPDLRSHIQSHLKTIRDVLESWNIITKLNHKKLTENEFLSELSTSYLRVSDPILSELYYGIKNRSSQEKNANTVRSDAPKLRSSLDTLETPQTEDDAPTVTGITGAETRSEAPVSESRSAGNASPLVESALRAARGLKMDFDRTDNFMLLRKAGFFQRLNDFCLNQTAIDDPEVEAVIAPVLLEIINKVDIWSMNILPEKYFVSDDVVNSIDWIQNISPVVYTCPLEYEDNDTTLGTVIKSRLSETFQALYYALAREQTAGEPPEILPKIVQTKTLRKRLDAENLAYIRSLIDRGEFESANQIINLHYSEAPYAFEQLNNEISGKRKEQADQKTISVINSVLNDLSSGDTNLETVRCLNSPKSAAMISERFMAFKNRSAQLFDMQDELGRVRNALNGLHGEMRTNRILTIGTLAAALFAVIFTVVEMTSMMVKNVNLEKSIAVLSTSLAESQSAAESQRLRLEMTMSAPTAVLPTEIPTAIPTPTEIPTLEPAETAEEEIPEEEAGIAALDVPEADRHMESLMNKAVTFDLTASLALYRTSDLNLDDTVGAITNYVNDLTGRVVGYTDRAINIEAEFNIGRSQISTNNNIDVQSATYMRLYSSVPSETTPIFILQKPLTLTEQARDCTAAPQQFCHGTVSIWFDRGLLENNLR